jgi:hypothetical protein
MAFLLLALVLVIAAVQLLDVPVLQDAAVVLLATVLGFSSSWIILFP